MILVYAEHSKGQLKRPAVELLCAGSRSGQKVAAVVFGSTAKSLVAQVASYGASDVHIIGDARLDSYNPELFTAALAQIVEKVQPKTLLAPSSATGKDLFPRLAARLKTGVVSDCTDLTFAGDRVAAKRPLYSGKCFATASFENSAVQIVLMRPNQLPVGNPDSSRSAATTEHSLPQFDLKTILNDVVRGTTEKLDLTEANIVVAGGRGLKDAANFKLVEQLADALGATVGASRAIVDAGWVSHSMQVGQTGKTVAPSLYIAIGISGAIQHLAGMSGAKVIVAINNDPNAPIFQKATYGIVGDLFDVVPKLTEEFKKALTH